jgi:predicted RNA-binding Zn-ribbon protein involved in translation (DUF1610 family)
MQYNCDKCGSQCRKEPVSKDEHGLGKWKCPKCGKTTVTPRKV